MKRHSPAMTIALNAGLLFALSVYPARAIAVDNTSDANEAYAADKFEASSDYGTTDEPDTDQSGKWIHSAEGWKYLIGGEEAAGLQIIDSVPYYFNPTSHVMATGWVKDTEAGCWYYANGSALYLGVAARRKPMVLVR